MSLFGPWYPPTLQQAVSHAERIVDLLTAHELQPPLEHGAAETRAWLWGRSAEVVCYVQSVVDDWRAGARGQESAAAAIEEYLAFLHRGLAERLGVRAPRCCELCDTALLDAVEGATRAENCAIVVPLSEVWTGGVDSPG